MIVKETRPLTTVAVRRVAQVLYNVHISILTLCLQNFQLLVVSGSIDTLAVCRPTKCDSLIANLSIIRTGKWSMRGFYANCNTFPRNPKTHSTL